MEDEKIIKKFKAKIEMIKFYNDDNNYHVMTFSTDQSLPNLKNIGGKYVGTIVGNCVKCIEGDTCNVEAECIRHPTFGFQYQIISLNYERPMDAKGMYTFLSAILTEAQATVLYNAYPDITDRVLADNNYVPDLKSLRGIGEATWYRIREKIIDNLGYSELITLLSPVGCTLAMIKTIGKGEKNLSLLKQKIINNPYILCEIPRMGFKKVDGFAIKINPDIEHGEQRVYACINYILDDIANNDGHCFIPEEDLKTRFKELITDKDIIPIFEEVIACEREKNKTNNNPLLYVDENNIGSLMYKRMEQFILDKFIDIQNTYNVWELKYDEFFKSMENTTKQQGFYLSDEQIEAVRSISEKNITVISGKAGTGKTSVIKAILEVYKDKHIGMAALSAKAAKRMREVTGFVNACTIHRLLGYKGSYFEYNENMPFSYDLLILDECSMNNIYLFYSILKATKNNTKIILAGDFCQLASIGVGSVFSDLVNNPIFNNHLLTQVYRQSDTSFINEHANIVREGIMPFDIDKGIMPFGKDVLYIFRTKSEDILNTTVNLYLESLKTTNIEDIIVVVPRKDTVIVSCESINKEIQKRLLANESQYIMHNNKIFKKGSRVINKKNDYEKGILNGELGNVLFVDQKNMTVQFDEGNIVHFKKGELDNLELGYAISVHSSQGSQYKTTIVAMDMSSYTLLTSNMIYTAMTRACDRLIIVSQPTSFVRSVTNVQEHYRNTYLKQLLPEVNTEEINNKIKEYSKQHPCIYKKSKNLLSLHDDEDEIIIGEFTDDFEKLPF